jgi:hypothetical protein
VSTSLQTLRSSILLEDSRPPEKANVGDPDCRWRHDSSLDPTNGAHHLPLHSRDGLLAVCVRSQRRKVPMPAVGYRLRDEQCHLLAV